MYIYESSRVGEGPQLWTVPEGHLFVRALRCKYPTVRASPYLILELEERRFCGRRFGFLRLRICMQTQKVYVTSAVFTRMTSALKMDTPVSSPHFNVYMHAIYQTKAQEFLFHVNGAVTIVLDNSGRKPRFHKAPYPSPKNASRQIIASRS